MSLAMDREVFLTDLGQIGTHARRCVRCGFCNAVCASSNVSSAFRDSRTSRGRIILLQSIAEAIGEINPYSPSFKKLIDLCISCRRCIPVCPPGIPIPDLISHARYAYFKRRKWAPSLGHLIYSDYGAFDRLGSMTAPLSNWVMRRQAFRKPMEWTTHIDARARLPPFHRESFESWFRKHANVPGKEIVYFVDSYANYNDPSIGKTVVSLLEHLGYRVILPQQKESGMPSVEFGLFEKARRLARYNLAMLAPYAKAGTHIVCSSLAASYLLREGYRELVEGDEALVVADAVTDMMELLLEEYHKGALHFAPPQIPQKVDYHCCCLSRALSLAPVTTKLLEAAGFTCRQIDDCCGGAGVWGTFKQNYEISSEIAGKLVANLSADGILVTESETCKMQIEAHSDNKALFPMQLLAPRVAGLRFAANHATSQSER